MAIVPSLFSSCAVILRTFPHSLETFDLDSVVLLSPTLAISLIIPTWKWLIYSTPFPLHIFIYFSPTSSQLSTPLSDFTSCYSERLNHLHISESRQVLLNPRWALPPQRLPVHMFKFSPCKNSLISFKLPIH